MKKVDPNAENDLRPEYRREDLGKGVRGKYYEAYTKSAKLVFLDTGAAGASNMSDTAEDEELDARSFPTTCFVIGPIGDRHAAPGSPERQIYEESITVWEEVISPACDAFGIKPVRADQIQTTGEIPEQVFRRLRDDHLVIADLTGANPNVMYELGLRHTIGKLTIQIGERSRLPFDISAIRTIQFKRTEAGLIDARKRLAQVISEGLQRGGDYVTATRVWFELPGLSQSGGGVAEDLVAVGEEEPGFLEKISDMLEGMESLGKIGEVISVIIIEIGQLTSEATAQIERINNQGGAPAAKLEIANRLARKFEDPAARLEILVGEYSRDMERISPGATHILRELRDNPEARKEAGEFTQQMSSLINTIEETASKIASFRDSLIKSGEASRESRRVNKRIAASLDLMLSANGRMEEWKALLNESESGKAE